jgi:acetyl-CoA carboxylase biotin carboxyl carrier protein
MDIKDLKTLIKLVTDTDITEFELENSEEKILIKRGSQPEVVQYAAPQQIVAAPAQVAAAPIAIPAIAASATAPAPADDKYETITSPMVGTFYRKPGPDADNFVEVGVTVDVGATVCLVEAMKMFNDIEAEYKCRIVEILKDDAAPVEFGEALFKIERI